MVVVMFFSTLFEALCQPFIDYGFMRSALAACVCLTLSTSILGIFIVFKRISLMGEALSHGILPGIAIAFMISGLSTLGLTIGGMIAGILVVLLSVTLSKNAYIPEDSSLTAMYIIFLSIGFLLLSAANSGVHLTHILFGNILAIDTNTLILIISVACATLCTMFFLTKPLLYASFDPIFLKLKGYSVSCIQSIFLVLVVLNLVAACQAIGTLMALGVMLLPAITSRILTTNFKQIVLLSILLGLSAGFIGLLTSYHFNLSSGPTIVLLLGLFFFISLVTPKKMS
jgi:zinc/manganese transport system permease protein